MTISLNGEKVEVDGVETLAELIRRYQFSPQSILVEHNGLALHRRDWPQKSLAEGDRVELIRVVAGG